LHQMKKILFPTAYAAHSKVAFRYTQKLAQYFEASITLVHIYESPTSTLTSTGALISEELKYFAEQQWDKEMTKLKSFADELNSKQYHQIKLDFIATDGDVVGQLLDIQMENDFDLIVMGTKRHHTFDRIFGNTTYSLIDEITCPLLLIPPDAHFIHLDKILYGTAFKTGEVKTIEYLLDWCLAFGSTLNLLHVHGKENASYALTKMAELTETFEREKKAEIVTANLIEGKISSILDQYIKSTGVDLLAIHRRKKGLLQEMTDGSLTKTLSEEIQIPLLVLKS
ncbi:MAG: universal stress protein, partial [Saprospiraceae bacterium]